MNAAIKEEWTTDTQGNKEASQMRHAKWKKPDPRLFTEWLHLLICDILKRENNRNTKQISGCQGLGWKEGLIASGWEGICVVREYWDYSTSFTFFQFGRAACGILVPQPGIQLVPPALEAWNLNPWTAREVPPHLFVVVTTWWSMFIQNHETIHLKGENFR